MGRKRKKVKRSEKEDSDVEIISSTTGPLPLRKRSSRRCKDKKLNDSTFENCFNYMLESISEKKRSSFTYFGCTWFLMYLNVSYKEKVLTWIKKQHIFSKKYVFVPIVCWSHWRLVIFCNFGEDLQSKTRSPCILLLDSLHSAEPMRVEPDIRRLVLDIYKAEDRPEAEDLIHQIPLLMPKVPQQINGEECGFFVLYYIYLFVEKARKSFNMSKGYPHFMKEDWFTHDSLEQFSEQFAHLKTENPQL